MHLVKQINDMGSCHVPGLNLFPFESHIGSLGRDCSQYRYPLATCKNIVLKYEVGTLYSNYIASYYDELLNNESNNTVNYKNLLKLKNKLNFNFDIEEYNNIKVLNQYKFQKLNNALLNNLFFNFNKFL